MIISLNQISQALTDQYEQLFQEPTKKNSRELVIEDVAVKVFIEMEYIKSVIPQGAVFCGGKLGKNNVKVQITPANEQVRHIIEEHLINQKYPAIFSGPEMSLFDSIDIINAQ